MDSIRAINGLTTDRLVVGQDLLIPTNMYTVQPGDSLYTISQMSFISINKIRLYQWITFGCINDRNEVIFASKNEV